MAAIIQHQPSISICSSLPQMTSDINGNKITNTSSTCKTRSQTNSNLQKLKRKSGSRNANSSESASSGGAGGEKGGSVAKASAVRSAPKEKEPHLVQRRNARERRRVQLVNDGFIRLRRKIPTEPRNKKLSKVKTLRSAINYILHLQQMITESDTQQQRMIEYSGPHHPHHGHHQAGGYGLGMGGLIAGHPGPHPQMPPQPSSGAYEWDHYAENQPMREKRMIKKKERKEEKKKKNNNNKKEKKEEEEEEEEK
ncbi:basic helix-loop-helix transcription factor scleraxis-like [Lytechinus pictus]|uniref:basic helix-loop-helix transcription factor scleraxis-like n=1 Tax=Lytechinus pictus TaxID=7653 RepID=UPI0030B9F8AB